MVNVILAEDDRDLRDSLIDCLKLHGHNIIGVANALAFYQAISAEDFDITIMDIGLPDQSGLEIIQHLNEISSMGIIVLTAMKDRDLRRQGYQNGADVYLTKPTSCQELSAAIHNLSQRLNAFAHPSDSAPNAQEEKWALSATALQLTLRTGQKIDLSARETDFLKMVMSHPGSIVHRQVVCRSLGLVPKDENDRRMDALIRRLRKKIKDASGLNLPIHTVYGEGYIFSGLAEVHLRHFPQNS